MGEESTEGRGSPPPNDHGPVARGSGFTGSERYLRSLGEHLFLSLWCYANLHKKPAKELCDLLVVFGDHVIIFSDKNCQYPQHSDPKVAWRRWFKKSVAEGARQVWGAERWIKTFPDRLFLDAKCTKPFPFALTDMSKAKFHLVLVARGASEPCNATFGGSGSLMYKSAVQGLDNHDEPFVIGDLNPAKTFVHVMDDTTMEIVLRNRDTVVEFIAYLQKKEAFLRSGRRIFTSGEEELLAEYLKDINRESEHDFLIEAGVTDVIVVEGGWSRYLVHPQRRAQIEADEISYVWDGLIEQFNKHALAGTQERIYPGSLTVTETIVRFMAATPRYVRRGLATSLMTLIRETNALARRLRVHQPWRPGEPYFVLLVFPYRKDRPYAENRRARLNFLHACCRVTKLRFSDAKDIVGVATESGRFHAEDGSEDATYFDAHNWTDKENEEAKRLQKELDILTHDTRFEGNMREYPDAPPAAPQKRKISRNEPCPCGSGLKYKRCHGR
jgi:hypothetical protein